MQVARLENPVREYAWGSRTVLAELLGRPAPSAAPEAELWMGAHPSAPSRLRVGGRETTLCELIERHPREVLGPEAVERFGPQLPFLFKVLAVEKPLSVQAHPDAEQAREGFARENARRIPLDAPQRCYRDASHKPELICALTPFQALRGFRPVAEIRALLERLDVPGLAAARRALDSSDEAHALRDLLVALLEPDVRDVVAEAAAAAARLEEADPAFAWLARLAREHPGDMGALAPLYLRLLRLEPGEAMFLPPGELHAYLQGAGVELMANSDNVLRGGLTPKHVDVPELLRILAFRAVPVDVLRPEPGAGGWRVYPTPAREFELSRLELGGSTRETSCPARGAQILLCTEGSFRVRTEGSALELARGASCLLPHAAGPCRLTGKGTLFRAALPS